MSTLRHKQLMPTPELLEEIYDSLKTADERVLMTQAANGNDRYLAQAIRHTIAAVSLLADLVDREATASAT
jgi:hypothetical protein